MFAAVDLKLRCVCLALIVGATSGCDLADTVVPGGEPIAVVHGVLRPDLPEEFRAGGGAGGGTGSRGQGETGPRTMAEIERQAILETLELTDGKRAESAKLLGIGLRTLQRKLKEYREQGHFQGAG